jgi:hypothetical protein
MLNFHMTGPCFSPTPTKHTRREKFNCFQMSELIRWMLLINVLNCRIVFTCFTLFSEQWFKAKIVQGKIILGSRLFLKCILLIYLDTGNASEQSVLECRMKNFEVKCYKFKTKVYANKTETEEYKEPRKE